VAILVDANTKILIQGITGREASMVVRHSLDYGTHVVSGVSPGKCGENVHGVPVYDTVQQACSAHELNTAVIYVPPAFAYDAVMEALNGGIKLILIITERIPRQDVAKFIHAAHKLGCTIVGPNSVGIISPGERVKVGAIGGDNPSRCFVPGEVGVISRSGGMTAECAWMVKRAGLGVSTCVSVGGDALIGSTPKEILAQFEDDIHTKAVLLWGEPGTSFEEEVADFIAEGGFTKPLIGYVGGQFVENLPEGTVFGHAASIIQAGHGKPTNKINQLEGAGALMARTFNEIIPLLQSALGASNAPQVEA
jgi:succinyl-CoA synthetase alpha subunit